VEESMTVYEELQMQEPHLYGDGIFKPIPRWKKCAQELLQKYRYFSGINEQHLS
jgi:hypothetical protein